MGNKIIKRLLLLLKSDKLFLYFITTYFHYIFILFIIISVISVVARSLPMQSSAAFNYFGCCIKCCDNWIHFFDVDVGNSIIGKSILIVLFSLAFFALCLAITWIRYIYTFIWIRICPYIESTHCRSLIVGDHFIIIYCFLIFSISLNDLSFAVRLFNPLRWFHLYIRFRRSCNSKKRSCPINNVINYIWMTKCLRFYFDKWLDHLELRRYIFDIVCFLRDWLECCICQLAE